MLKYFSLVTEVEVFVIESSIATIANVDTISHAVDGYFCTNIVFSVYLFIYLFIYLFLKYDSQQHTKHVNLVLTYRKLDSICFIPLPFGTFKDFIFLKNRHFLSKKGLINLYIVLIRL